MEGAPGCRSGVLFVGKSGRCFYEGGIFVF